jgi:site-specific recombinase XerD
MLGVVKHLFSRRPAHAAWPLEAHRAHLDTEYKGRTPVTYSGHVRAFSRVHRDPWAVTSLDVEAYLARMTGRDGRAAESTRRSALSALKDFYRWAVKHRLTGRDPTAHSKLGGGKTQPGQTCDEFTYRAALEAAKDDSELLLMLLLMGEAGLRCAEVAGCRGDKVSEDGRWLTVVGKGDKARRVPITAAVRDRILERGNGWTFAGGRGRANKGLTPQNVGIRVGRLVKPYSAHSLRHRAALAVYRRTRDLVAVQQVLGHESLTTTQIYLGVSPDEVWTAWTSGIEQSRGA